MTLFGQSPKLNKLTLDHIKEAEAVFVIGTSLRVEPANTLHLNAHADTKVIYINRTPPPDAAITEFDAILLGDANAIFTSLLNLGESGGKWVANGLFACLELPAGAAGGGAVGGSVGSGAGADAGAGAGASVTSDIDSQLTTLET
jgi:hypothetical protein